MISDTHVNEVGVTALRPLWIYVGVTGSLLLRLSVLDFESGDYQQFLSDWYDQIVGRGRWNALADDFYGSTVGYGGNATRCSRRRCWPRSTT